MTVNRDGDVTLLARWLGVSDVTASTLLDVSDELRRAGTDLEVGAAVLLERVEEVAAALGLGHILAGSPPASALDERVAEPLRDLVVRLQHADRVHQVLNHAADILVALAEMSNEQSAHTLRQHPPLRSTALDEAERLRVVHESVGLGTLRRKLMAGLGLKDT